MKEARKGLEPKTTAERVAALRAARADTLAGVPEFFDHGPGTEKRRIVTA